MRFSDFERWMFRLGAAAATVTLAAMAVRARIAPPPEVHAATTGLLLAPSAVRPGEAGEVSGAIPHVYAGQPVSTGWANRIVDSVNRSETRLAAMEQRPPEPPLEHHAFDVRDPSTREWTNLVVDKVNRVDTRVVNLEDAMVTKGFCDGVAVVRIGRNVICSAR